MRLVSLAMMITGKLVPICTLMLLITGPATAADTNTATPHQTELVADFLSIYCIGCHDQFDRQGDREFESFALPLSDQTGLITADEIIDQITLRQMPPLDAEQPTDDERLEVLQTLRQSIDDARQMMRGTGGRTVMRRLSNREYQNTIEDLIGRRVDTLGLIEDFPKDTTADHLDTIGQSLVTSGFLLDHYFNAASRLINTRLESELPEPQSWHFTDNFRQYEELAGANSQAFNNEVLCIYEQPDTDTRQGGFGHIEDFLEGVPASGNYKIEILVSAKHRDTHYDPDIFKIDFSEPFQIGIVPGDVRKGHIHYPQSVQPTLATGVVPDTDPQWMEFDVWLEQGQTPRFIFPNGPAESRRSIMAINDRYKDEFEEHNFSVGVVRTHILTHGALPRIQIEEVKIHGPIADPDGRLEEINIFGDAGFDADRAIEQLHGFATKAFRRPLEPLDRERIDQFYQGRLATSENARAAGLDTVTMILCSPSFLYLHEQTGDDEDHLGAHDLASRLSYALIAGPPDPLLRHAADDRSILRQEVLTQHAVRLIDDPKFERFVTAFLDGWLNLRDIGSMPPPRDQFEIYYYQDLRSSMRREVQLLFGDLIDRNGSYANLIDSDYTFVDKYLAHLYGLPIASTLKLSDGFVRADLTDHDHRGGLLGTAAVQCVSANGVETSPVTRGVWVLENMLGTPPPPPPDEVPSIENDVRGATTIREVLAKHSADQTCFVCHRNIDPMGFAMELFDPIGRWRDRYPATDHSSKQPPIDPTGRFPSGQQYRDFETFKQVLLETRGDLFLRGLVQRLLMYASGRHMEAADRYEINEIMDRVKKDNGGMRTLLIEVMTSEIVRSA